MQRGVPLLIEDPRYVLAPNIELTQSNVERMIKEREKRKSSDCDICGKGLGTPYYISIGIPPSPLRSATYQCKSLNDENNTDFKNIVRWIQFVAEGYDINTNYQWIFSEQNIKGSKTRLCGNCQKRYGGKMRMPTVFVDAVCLAVQEYQRLSTPISQANSDYERYILSLPARTDVFWQHIRDADLSAWACADMNFIMDLLTNLKIALLPDSSDLLSQEIKTNYIQDKNRAIPNDQELTRWIQDQINCCCRCYADWYEIKDCKIFEVDMKDPEYIVVVHFSIPKGFWCAYEVHRRIQLEPFDRIMEDVGCYYCGENFRPCLDWHHLYPEQKEPAINKRTYHCLEKLKTEAQKCEVVCANCHHKYHAQLLEFAN